MAHSFHRTLRALDADCPGLPGLGWAGGMVGALLLLLAWLAWSFGGEVTLYEVSRSACIEAVVAAYPVVAAQRGALLRAHARLGESVRAGVQALCEELGLGELLRRMPAGLQQRIGETGWQISRGERSRLFLVRALLQRAPLTVLDGSFAALDRRAPRPVPGRGAAGHRHL